MWFLALFVTLLIGECVIQEVVRIHLADLN